MAQAEREVASARRALAVIRAVTDLTAEILGKKRELTAADYIYSIKRHYDPKLNSRNLYLLENVKILGLSELRKELMAAKKPFDYDREVEGLRVLDAIFTEFDTLVPGRFADIEAHLASLGVEAVDGVVLDGQSEVDRSLLTGESLPVFAGPDTVVSAGEVKWVGAARSSACRWFQSSRPRAASAKRCGGRSRSRRPASTGTSQSLARARNASGVSSPIPAKQARARKPSGRKAWCTFTLPSMIVSAIAA